MASSEWSVHNNIALPPYHDGLDQPCSLKTKRRNYLPRSHYPQPRKKINPPVSRAAGTHLHSLQGFARHPIQFPQRFRLATHPPFPSLTPLILVPPRALALSPVGDLEARSRSSLSACSLEFIIRSITESWDSNTTIHNIVMHTDRRSQLIHEYGLLIYRGSGGCPLPFPCFYCTRVLPN